MSQPALFLHGWGLHGGVWADTLRALPGTAVDLPGYGATPGVAPYRAQTLADALAARIDTPVAVVGWSMGGMVALALAARHADKVARLALVATSPVFVRRPDWPHGLEADVLAGFAASLRADYRATVLRFLSLQARGGDDARAVIGRLRAQVFARGEPDAATLIDGLQLLRIVDLRAEAAHVRCPTLVLHGAHDGLCPPAAARWLAGHIAGARLVLHERAAHAPFLSHPHWFVAQLGAFLHG